MNSNGLDEFDESILDVISCNARAGYEEIAQKVGVSRTAVKKRMQAMEDAKVIVGYKTQINRANATHASKFYIDIETYPSDFCAVMNYLGESAFVRELYLASGSNHIHAIGVAPNNTMLQAYVNKLNRELVEVRKLTVCSILSVCKDVDGGVDYVQFKESKQEIQNNS